MTTSLDSSDTDVYYDPYDLGISSDPWPTYARLREEAPIYYNEKYRFWAISRHSDVDEALADWETFSSTRSDILELVNSEFDMPKGVMMFEDPPVHTMLRGLMGRVFTPRRMAEIEDRIRAFCVNCLDPHVGSDGFDIIAELASMMPMRVIGMLLGIPESEQLMVRDANDANLRTKPGAPMKVAQADKIADGRIYAEYVEWRSKNPSDDLMTALLNVEFEDEEGVTRKLHRKEVLHYTQVVAGAGNEWIFPDLTEPRWSGVQYIAVQDMDDPPHEVDVSATVDKAVESLAEHRRYLELLSDVSVEEQAQQVIDMSTMTEDGRRRVGFRLYWG